MVTLRPSNTVFLCLVLFCLAFVASSASAERINVSPAGDGHVSHWFDTYGGGYVTNNTAGTMRVRQSFLDYGGGYVTGETSKGVLEIPVSSLQGINLTGATITLNFCVAVYDYRMEVYGGRFEGDGVVTEADYARSTGDNRVYQNDIHSTGWKSINVAPYVQEQVADGYSYANFYLQMYTGNYLNEVAAAEDTQGRGAYLEVIPVPEPSSLLALFAGISGLGGMLIRRRK